VTKKNGWGITGIDTITLSNGNIASQNEYVKDGPAWSVVYSYIVSSYSNYTNPLYALSQSSGLGAFLTNSNIMDCISKNLASAGILKWSVDSSGRVISGIGENGDMTIYTYAK
jgi:hypothetical protein